VVSVQIPLKMSIQEAVCFESFVTETSEIALALNQFQQALKSSNSSVFYLQGSAGAGKTHLLQAACRYKSGLNQSAVYLPLKDMNLPLIAESLKGLEQTALVCIDDIDTKIADESWQKSLATLLVKIQNAGHILVLSGVESIVDWPITLSELNAALVSVLPIHLMPLSQPKELVEALQRHAQAVGFVLPLEVGNFLVKQFSKNILELMAVLKLLEQETLVEKRRLTLPFVKQVLKWRK